MLECLHGHRCPESPLGKNRAQRRVSSCGELSLEESCWPSRVKELVLIPPLDADGVLGTNRTCFKRVFLVQ